MKDCLDSNLSSHAIWHLPPVPHPRNPNERYRIVVSRKRFHFQSLALYRTCQILRREVKAEDVPTPVICRLLNEAFFAGMGRGCPEVENKHHSVQHQ